MMGILKSILQIFGVFQQNARDSDQQATGMRKGELERRDKQDEIRKDAKKHRKIDNSATDSDVASRL